VEHRFEFLLNPYHHVDRQIKAYVTALPRADFTTRLFKERPENLLGAFVLNMGGRNV